MEYNQEANEQEAAEDYQNGSKVKQWLQDNLRIILSVLIVVLIAGGIYSYSKRTEIPAEVAQAPAEESITQEQGETQDQPIASEEASEAPTAADESVSQEDVQVAPEQNVRPQDQTSSISTSQETETSFIETATKGDGSTHLARRSLANYLEKNSDSSLTAEHKIYIEDYLRKHVPQKGSVQVGTSVEFSKDLIHEAIASSKNLNERQLQNLHKYAIRVPSLS